MLTANEKRALDCFPRPRTIEDAYRRSSFRNQANFKIYVTNLYLQGYLIDGFKKKQNDTLTVYRKAKPNEVTR